MMKNFADIIQFLFDSVNFIKYEIGLIQL